MEVTPNGLVLKEIGAQITLEEILKETDATLIISDDLKAMLI